MEYFQKFHKLLSKVFQEVIDHKQNYQLFFLFHFLPLKFTYLIIFH
nr:MAG TPA: hypothetical protein [Caudoviricetes sp.]